MMNNLTSVQNSRYIKEEKKINVDHAKECGVSGYSFAKDPDNFAKIMMEVPDRNNQQRMSSSEFNDLNIDVPEKELSNSSRTYVSIVNNPETNTIVKDKTKGQGRISTRKCRTIQGLAILFVLVVFGLIAFFIIRNLFGKDPCTEKPKIKHGNSTIRNPNEVVVYCEQGYGPDKNQTLTCENGKWSNDDPCPQTGCGPFPTIVNGFLTGNEMKFGSKARLQCNPGFVTNATTYFSCLSNGSWISDADRTCYIHPCGRYILSEHVVVKEDFSHVNMSINMQCEEGFDFAHGNETKLFCENNTWVGNPKCVIPGILKLETKNTSVLFSGKSFTITCRLTHSPNWDTVMLARADLTNGSSAETLLVVSNNKGNDTSEQIGNRTPIQSKITLLPDGVVVQGTIKHVMCEDSGIFICGVLVGNITKPRGTKTEIKQFKVIDTRSKLREIVTPTSVVQGDKIDVKCMGSIGRDDNGTKLGEMYIQIYKVDTIIESVQTTIESSQINGCLVNETINATILVTNDFAGAELQCILNGFDGERQKKSEILKVITTTVRLSTSSSAVYIGDMLDMTVELNHIRGWSNIEFRKNCSGMTVIIGSIKNNQGFSNLTLEEHIVLSESDITETSAQIVLHFASVRCSDACFEGGEIDISCAVKIKNSWEIGSLKVEFRIYPTIPVLTAEPDKFYRGQEAVIKCVGNVGVPEQDMVMTENSLELPTRLLDSEIILNNATCANIMTIVHPFSVTNDSEGSAFQCETSFHNGTKAASNVEIVNVSDPILYFTDESKTGKVGENKTIKCILTKTMNLTNIYITRFVTEQQKVCEVSSTGAGTCNLEGYSINGHFSDNGSIFTTTVTLKNVSCDKGGTYVCRAVCMDTFRTTMAFQVTSTATQPELRLPTTVVEGQMAEWEDDLNCTAHLGFPYKERQLKIQIKLKGANTFNDYHVSEAKGGQCGQNNSIVMKQIMFTAEHNGSFIRCAILDGNSLVIYSTEKEIKLLKNVCFSGNAGEYDPHPYDCRRYIRCVGTRLYDQRCADGSCALTDSVPICNDICTNC